MIISEAGFFRELPHGRPDGPSLHEALATGRQEPLGTKKEMLLGYLWGNTVLAAAAAMFGDVLDPAVTAVAPMAVVTDGAWVWPRDLAHYVEKYDAAVPLPFILHIELRGWEQPALSPNELLQIEQAVLEK